jgi:hypothetical protein
MGLPPMTIPLLDLQMTWENQEDNFRKAKSKKKKKKA